MTQTKHAISAQEALARLREGNTRFAANVRSLDALASQSQRASLVAGQSPFATILSCSDSRVPSEIVFDCGLGDLFVIRVAGNVVAPSIIGSIEFAAATFGTELVVVMGHSRCGAIGATLDVLEKKGSIPSHNIMDLVERITPAVKHLVEPGVPREELYQKATRANVRASMDRILNGSPLLKQRIQEKALLVVGAEYSLETGVVDFFEPAGAVGSAA